MSTRQLLFVDSIIGSVQQLIDDVAKDMDPKDMESFVIHVYDVLDNIGVPQQAIHLALGEHIRHIDDGQPGAPVPCWICDDPAVGLVLYKGEYRLACQRHGSTIAKAGVTGQVMDHPA